jgi:small subunit ribosomal protein S13
MADKKSKGSSKGKGKGKPQNKNKSQKKNKDPVFVKKTTTTERIKKAKQKPQPSHVNLTKESKDFRHIVRLGNRDVPGYYTIDQGLMLIYGISHRIAKAIKDIFEEKQNKIFSKVGYLEEKDVEIIEEIVENLENYVPTWLLNRPKMREGGHKHLIMADLQLSQRKELQRLGKIKSYRGLRLQWGLPVRGQKTKSSFRNKGKVVGVAKKK